MTQHLTALPELVFGNLATHDEFTMQSSQLWIVQKNANSELIVRRRVRRWCARRPCVARYRRGARCGWTRHR